MKLCAKCNEDKPDTDFYKNKRMTSGLESYCKKCNRAKNKIWATLNANKARISCDKWAAKNPITSKKIQAKAQSNWRKAHPEKNNITSSNYRAEKLKRIPIWLSPVDKLVLDSIYIYNAALRKVGLDYMVDHIIPMQGKLVSGLHIPENLQVITGSENSAKGNRFEL